MSDIFLYGCEGVGVGCYVEVDGAAEEMVDTICDEKLGGTCCFSAESVNNAADSGFKLYDLFVDGAGAGGVFVNESMGVFEVFFYVAVEGFVGEV